MNKNVKSILGGIQDFSKTSMKKFMKYEPRDRIFIAYLMLLAFFVLFMPIFSVQHVTNDTSTSFFLLGNMWFFKSFVMISLCLMVLIWWNISLRVKDSISLLFGFEKSTFLLNFSLLWVITTAYIGIWETIMTMKSVTPTVSISTSNIIVQFLLLAGLVYTLYLTVNSKKGGRQIHIINESRRENDVHEDSMFDDEDRNIDHHSNSHKRH